MFLEVSCWKGDDVQQPKRFRLQYLPLKKKNHHEYLFSCKSVTITLKRQMESSQPSLKRQMESSQPSIKRQMESNQPSLKRQMESTQPSLKRQMESSQPSLTRQMESTQPSPSPSLFANYTKRRTRVLCPSSVVNCGTLPYAVHVCFIG